MKIVAPPTISNLQQVADLLLNPAKYAKYCTDLQQMLDAINQRLGDLKLVEQVDEYAATAEAKALNAKKEYEESIKVKDTLIQEAQVIKQEAALSAQKTKDEANIDRENARVLKSKLEIELRSVEAELGRREKEIATKEVEIQKARTKLDEQVKQYNAKVEKLSAAMG